jgi:hypothetical protein
MSLPFSQLSNVTQEGSISQEDFDRNIDEKEDIYRGQEQQSIPIPVDNGPVPQSKRKFRIFHCY